MSFFPINHAQSVRNTSRPLTSFFSADSLSHASKGLLDSQTLLQIEATIRRMEEKARLMQLTHQQQLLQHKFTFNPSVLDKRASKTSSKQFQNPEIVDENHDKMPNNLANPQLPLVKREKNSLLQSNSSFKSIQKDLRRVYSPITKQFIDILITKPLNLEIVIDQRHFFSDLNHEKIDSNVVKLLRTQQRSRLHQRIVQKHVDDQTKAQKAVVKRVYKLPDKFENGQMMIVNKTTCVQNTCMDPYELVFTHQQNLVVIPCVKHEKSYREIVSIENVSPKVINNFCSLPHIIPKIPFKFSDRRPLRLRSHLIKNEHTRRINASKPPKCKTQIKLEFLPKKLFTNGRSNSSSSKSSNRRRKKTSATHSNASSHSTSSKINHLFQFLNEHDPLSYKDETHPTPLRDALQSALISFVQPTSLLKLTYDKRAKNFGWF